MKKTSKVTRLFLSCCLMLIICLINKPHMANAAKGQDSNTLVYAWSTNVGPLNPHDYGANMMFAQAWVYEPLVQYGPGGKILPHLAESWDISADQKTYTFYLRKDVRFSDGMPFTAHAIVTNLKAVFANKDRHSWLTLMQLIESYKAIDTYTFELTLARPYRAALQELTFVRPLRFISPKALTADGKFAKPVGTGPWVLSKTRKGESDLFTRNENYWGEKPIFRNILVKVIPDVETRALALESEAVDIIATAMGDHGSADISPAAYDMLSKQEVFTSKSSTARNTRLIAMNTAIFPTNDLAVRQAIVQTIDRKAILSGILLNQELPAESLMHNSIPYCDQDLSPYPFDPTQAASILDAAGWKLAEGNKFRSKNGQTLQVNLKFIANESIMRAIAEAAQSNLAQIGIDVRLVGEEPVSFMQSQVDGSFNLIFCNSSGAPYAPFSYLGIMGVPGHAEYQAQLGLKDKAMLDAAIQNALFATDEATLKTSFNNIWRILHDEVVYIPLSYTVDKALYKKSLLQDFEFAPVSYELLFNKLSRP